MSSCPDALLSVSIQMDGQVVNLPKGRAMERLLHPISDVVYLTGLSRSVIYEKIAAGELESVKAGSRRLIPHEALVDYIERLRAGNRVPAA